MLWGSVRPGDFESRILGDEVSSTGKWLVNLAPGDPDDLWGRIAARAGTSLRAVKRSSPVLDAKVGHGIVCVYCVDSEIPTVRRTLEALRAIGVTGVLEYKSDLATHRGTDRKLYLSPEGATVERTGEDAGMDLEEMQAQFVREFGKAVDERDAAAAGHLALGNRKEAYYDLWVSAALKSGMDIVVSGGAMERCGPNVDRRVARIESLRFSMEHGEGAIREVIEGQLAEAGEVVEPGRLEAFVRRVHEAFVETVEPIIADVERRIGVGSDDPDVAPSP